MRQFDFNDPDIDTFLVDTEDSGNYFLYQFDTVPEDKVDYPYMYKVVDEDGKCIGTFFDSESAFDLKYNDYLQSVIHYNFMSAIRRNKRASGDKTSAPWSPAGYVGRKGSSDTKKGFSQYDLWGGYGDDIPSTYSRFYSWTPPKKSTGFLDKLNKSDTLVVHCEDRSTDMLSQIYEGRGWDVLRDGNIDQEELHELIRNHERIVCLGHGTSAGLINKQGGGCTIGREEAPLLKDKKLFVICCNADSFFLHYCPEAKGQFITTNLPSEVWECRAAGCGNISTGLMLENITYWSKLCAEAAPACLEGNVHEGVAHIRKNYLEKYGNHPVTIFNALGSQALGEPEPLPAYEFKGEPLQPKDYPYPGFNEEEFLKNPTASVR